MPVRLTESYLRKIIREEVSRALNEEERMSFKDAFEIEDADSDSRAKYIKNHADSMKKAEEYYNSGDSIFVAIKKAASERLRNIRM